MSCHHLDEGNHDSSIHGHLQTLPFHNGQEVDIPIPIAPNCMKM